MLVTFGAECVSSYREPPLSYGPSDTTSATLLPDGTRVFRPGDWLMTCPALTFALFTEVTVEVRPTAAILDRAAARTPPITSGALTGTARPRETTSVTVLPVAAE